MRIGDVRARLRPAGRFLAIARQFGGWGEIKARLDGEELVDSLAKLIERQFEQAITSDGRVDFRELSARVLREVGNVQVVPRIGGK